MRYAHERASATGVASAASAGSLALALALAPVPARAQTESLRQEADRVVDEWRRDGALVARTPPRFLYDSDSMTLTLPPSESPGETCTTIAVLGGRGMSFHARAAGVEDDPLNDDPSARAASVAGVLEIGGCGDAAGPLERLRVTSDAGRGAIEIVVARSPRSPSPIRTVLPERTGGTLPPPPDAGPQPSLPPPERRADLAEARAKREGAAALPRAAWDPAGDGSGDAKLSLEGGCHRVEIFAADVRPARPSHRRRLDVDAEIRDEDEDLLARDRTDSADARLELCVGATTNVTVIFAGAPVGVPVLVTHAWWPIPTHVPSLWGPEPRARMAHALLSRKAKAPPEDAVALYEGLSGSTPLPLAIEPGACYLAVAAITNGHARGLGLRALLGAQEARDERTSDDDAGVVAFCAGDHDLARLEVDARGATIRWGLAVFRVMGRQWQGVRER